ncbi:hypothetical protein TNIN_455471 [Trichonephila inaurata madagascariensis]|uniref:Uncharacterized protein n=1 Tax=Trichonephila inaurata madagascariensis TaxID=2747483 RepID=A0A8X6X5U9_9ARAC|nr:hypothetical protein TNIN_455471 [Trichonephila inaurata madagascariensis]
MFPLFIICLYGCRPTTEELLELRSSHKDIMFSKSNHLNILPILLTPHTGSDDRNDRKFVALAFHRVFGDCGTPSFVPPPVVRLSLEQSSFFLGDAFDVCEGLQAGSSGSCSKGSLQEESGSDARAGLCLLKRGARGCVGKTFKKTPVELFLHSFGIRAGHHQR